MLHMYLQHARFGLSWRNFNPLLSWICTEYSKLWLVFYSFLVTVKFNVTPIDPWGAPSFSFRFGFVRDYLILIWGSFEVWRPETNVHFFLHLSRMEGMLVIENKHIPWIFVRLFISFRSSSNSSNVFHTKNVFSLSIIHRRLPFRNVQIFHPNQWFTSIHCY